MTHYSLKYNPEFFWSEDRWLCTCIITNKYGTFTGRATCHPDDEDINSKLTGEEIAYTRAQIKMLQHRRNSIIKPSLRALKQLHYSQNRSKRYNAKSYEANMLKRQIEFWEFELNVTNDGIDSAKEFLHNYIEQKDKFAQEWRKKGQNKKD